MNGAEHLNTLTFNNGRGGNFIIKRNRMSGWYRRYLGTLEVTSTMWEEGMNSHVCHKARLRMSNGIKLLTQNVPPVLLCHCSTARVLFKVILVTNGYSIYKQDSAWL